MLVELSRVNINFKIGVVRIIYSHKNLVDCNGFLLGETRRKHRETQRYTDIHREIGRK